MNKLLEIKDLHATAGEKEILKGLNITVNKGEIHVIMGPNGAGKSTLANVILNNPEYKKTSGEIDFEGENINNLSTDKIAQKGIFMSFQSPEEIPGISSFNFLKVAKNKIENEVVTYAEEELSKLKFLTLYMTPNRQNHSSVISFNIKGVHPHDVASILDSENVCVRSGNHCAQPLLRYLGIDSTCRASFYFYNTKQDVDKLVKALNKAYSIFEKYIKN